MQNKFFQFLIIFSILYNLFIVKIVNRGVLIVKIIKNCILFAFSLLFLILSVVSLTQTEKSVVFADNLVSVDVKEYCLMDSNTGTILAENNSTEKREVASMVKLMTSLLVMEKIERGEWTLDTELLVSDYAASMEGSQAFLDAGKTYKVDDLLKSVIVASANDSSVVLAENYAGSEVKFVDYMNAKAKELGMNDTLYGNSTGLPALNQYSTARDIAKILNVVLKHDLYHKYSTIWMDKLVHASGRETELVNTNRLVKYYPGCDCGKTGFTDEAGYCLSASAKRNDMRLISVVMGAKTTSDRFTASSNLLNYGFSNFKIVKVVNCEDTMLSNIKLKGLKNFVECKAENDLYVLQKSGSSELNYEIKTDFKEFKKQVKKGEIVGSIQIISDGNILSQTNLIASNDYKTPNFVDITHMIFDNWSI